VYHQGTKNFVVANSWLWILAFVVMIVTMLAMACCESVRRTSPTNVIFLGIFTIAQSFMLGVVSVRFRSEEILMGVGITAAVCFALTLFAFQTKWDFTMMGGILFVAVVILFLFGLVAMFFPGKTIQLIYGSVGALIFSVYLIYDTQMIMGGKHKYSISPEEHIFAALSIYLVGVATHVQLAISVF
jgi:protein lifeguard